MAHSMGYLIALSLVITHPDLIKNLVLIGPPPNPLPAAASTNYHARGALVREKWMMAVVDAISTAGTSERTKAQNPLALTAVRLSLLSQDPEGYAKACSALAGATTAFDIEKIQARTLIITGDEDKVSPPDLCRKIKERVPNCVDVVVLKDAGHWHVYEDIARVSTAVGEFLKG
jgi:pimeloyl-ACP methyl ester carboxylesterase